MKVVSNLVQVENTNTDTEFRERNERRDGQALS